MEINDFLRKVEDAIDNVEQNTLTAELKFQTDLEAWDSLAALTLLAMIDSEYNVVISGEEITSCETLNDLFETVKNKSNS